MIGHFTPTNHDPLSAPIHRAATKNRHAEKQKRSPTSFRSSSPPGEFSTRGHFSLCVVADAHRGLPIALLPHPTTNLAADLSFIQPPTHDKNLHTMSNAELASSYAALILADDAVEITVSLFYCYCRNGNSTYPWRSTADAISKPSAMRVCDETGGFFFSWRDKRFLGNALSWKTMGSFLAVDGDIKLAAPHGCVRKYQETN